MDPPLFPAAAFFGKFSTTCGALDGFPRAFSETLARAWPSPALRVWAVAGVVCAFGAAALYFWVQLLR